MPGKTRQMAAPAAGMAPTSMRLSQDVKEALARMAADDQRSVTMTVDRVLRAVLVERGYLPAPKPGAVRRRA
jgi:hypothetical protein